jgi:BASS family bile acid:Na+ symporter
MEIDSIQLNFSSSGLLALNIVLGLVMFGIALDLKLSDFRYIWKKPIPFFVGLVGQFILLPVLSLLLVYLFSPQASIALGMILVASCPGGNISNFLTHLSKGNTALSISMSGVSTLASAFMTPFLFILLSNLVPNSEPILTELKMPYGDLAISIFLLLALPLGFGIWIANMFPKQSARLAKIFRYVSIFVFVSFVFLALGANWKYFLNYVGLVIILVFVQNAFALGSGYLASRIANLAPGDRKAVTLEVGIQNSGLGLILVFNFFQGLGGMAIVCAWWGIWHIISGLSLALFWSRQEIQSETKEIV